MYKLMNDNASGSNGCDNCEVTEAKESSAESILTNRKRSSDITTNDDTGSIAAIINEYTAACRIYGCHERLNPGILTTLRFRLPALRVSGSFHDADMLALAEVLLHHCNGALSHIRRLDFSLAATEGKSQLGGRRKGVRSHGAYALSRVLQMSVHIEEVFLPGNKIGPYGASAIFCAARTNPTLRTLLLRGCGVGERGAFALVSQILMAETTEDDGDATTRTTTKVTCGLREVDLSCNRIGFYGVHAVEDGLKRRMKLLDDDDDKQQQHDQPRPGRVGGMRADMIEVDMESNMVFQEVMNCITHGLGIILAMVGSILLSRRVRGKPMHYVLSCAIYSSSIVVLYLSSTLFHSFFKLKRTQYIFQVFDMCAIYILIAGSYTPFLSIALHHKPMFSGMLLAYIWTCSLSGICVHAMLPLWKHKPKFSLAMYLGMGWSCLVCMKDLRETLPAEAIYFVIAGGVAYTAGVPFFVRNSNLDHSIWHCFVLAGSIFHWLGVYLYVVNI